MTALTRARGRFGTSSAAIEREISGIEASVASQQGSGGAPSVLCNCPRLLCGTKKSAVRAESVRAAACDHSGGCCIAGFQALFGGRNLRPLLIGSSLMLYQQITGGLPQCCHIGVAETATD